MHLLHESQDMTDQMGFSVTIEAQLERFEKAMRDGGRVVDTTAAGMDKATQRAAKSFTRLEGALDPASRALQRYERDVNKVKIAVDTGAISQERASAVLERLDQQYRRAAMGSEMFEVTQQRASIMSGRMGFFQRRASTVPSSILTRPSMPPNPAGGSVSPPPFGLVRRTNSTRPSRASKRRGIGVCITCWSDQPSQPVP
jgi:hypothetical protein